MISSSEKRQVFKTKQGTIKSQDLKAIQWYMIQHNVKPMAINVFPYFHFKDSDGVETEVHLADVQDQYEEFKRLNHGSRKNAA